jgi:hypothetical protein
MEDSTMSNMEKKEMEDIHLDKSSSQEVREPQVQRCLKYMEKEISWAEELFDNVNKRLTSVLREEASPRADNAIVEGNPKENLTPLASRIMESVRKLENISRGYEHMLSLMEL